MFSRVIMRMSAVVNEALQSCAVDGVCPIPLTCGRHGGSDGVCGADLSQVIPGVLAFPPGNRVVISVFLTLPTEFLSCRPSHPELPWWM